MEAEDSNVAEECESGLKTGSTDLVVCAAKGENTTTPWTRSLTWSLT